MSWRAALAVALATGVEGLIVPATKLTDMPANLTAYRGKIVVVTDHAKKQVDCAPLLPGNFPVLNRLSAKLWGDGQVEVSASADNPTEISVHYQVDLHNIRGDMIDFQRCNLVASKEWTGSNSHGVCGLAVHEGTCAEPGNVVDPKWLTVHWFSNIYTAEDETEVELTGVNVMEEAAGKPVVIHNYLGEQVGCAMLAKKEAENLLIATHFKIKNGFRYPAGEFTEEGKLFADSRVKVSAGAGSTAVVQWRVWDADPDCWMGSGDAPNSCGVHIHAGSSCEEPGGHFFKGDADADPWTNVNCTSKEHKTAEAGHILDDKDSIKFYTKLTPKDLKGKKIVFFDDEDNVTSCGTIGDTSEERSQEATVTKASGYKGTKALDGKVSLKRVESFDEFLTIDFSLSAEGDEVFCGRLAAKPCKFALMVATAACEPVTDLGEHEDDWSSMSYMVDHWAANTGVKVNTGMPWEQHQKKTLVVHDVTGARVACAVITRKELKKLQATDFEPYAGYKGDLIVTGEVFMSPVGSTASEMRFLLSDTPSFNFAALYENGVDMKFALQGTDPQCDGKPKEAPNACGIHIHAGESCADAGKHFHAENIEDPWTVIVYKSEPMKVRTVSDTLSKAEAWLPWVTTTTITITTTTITTTTTTMVPQEVEVKVQGQSGKMTVWDKKRPDDKIVIEMDALKEIDAEGNAVGTSGSEKHSVNTFANQDFTIEDPVMDDMNQIKVNRLSFNSPIGAVGKVKVDTFIMAQDGQVGPPGELFDVKQGDFKWNIKLGGPTDESGWKWCGDGATCKQGQKAQVGAFIDVVIKITSKGEPVDEGKKGKHPVVSLGAGMDLQLSNKVMVDDKWQDMPTGFPKVETQGSGTILTFRFPKFSKQAMYDPVITGMQEEVATTTTTTTSTTTTTGAKPEPSKIKVDVLGQSGKFTCYDENRKEETKVTINMDSISEVNSKGEAVGASGTTKHSLNTFAAQDFQIADNVLETMDGVKTNKISFTSKLKGDVGAIQVDTFIMDEDGEVGPPAEKVKVKKGDFKWNVVLKDWKFCGSTGVDCKKGKDNEVGAFVDFQIALSGSFDKAQADDKKHLTLKEGQKMVLSSKVQVDGNWQEMPEGYPKVDNQGSKVVLTFRFPKFTKQALYDPIVTGMAVEEETSSGGSGGSGGDSGGASGSASDGASGSTGGSEDKGGNNTGLVIAIVVIILAALGGLGFWFMRGSGDSNGTRNVHESEMRHMTESEFVGQAHP